MRSPHTHPATRTTRTVLLTSSALLLMVGLCPAQELTSDEKKFIAAVADVVSSTAAAAETDKEEEEGPDGKQEVSLEIELPKHEIKIARLSSAKRAFEAASDMALYSGWADDPMLIEVRGRDLLVIEGPLAVEGRPGMPEDLPSIVLRMLAKDPGDRFQTAEEVRRALEDIIVPDMMRLKADKQVLNAWRKSVRSSTAGRQVSDLSDTRVPLGLSGESKD